MPSDARSRFAVKNLEILFNGLRNRCLKMTSHGFLHGAMSRTGQVELSVHATTFAASALERRHGMRVIHIGGICPRLPRLTPRFDVAATSACGKWRMISPFR